MAIDCVGKEAMCSRRRSEVRWVTLRRDLDYSTPKQTREVPTNTSTHTHTYTYTYTHTHTHTHIPRASRRTFFTIRSTLRRLAPGSDGMGVSRFSPSCTNSGRTRSEERKWVSRTSVRTALDIRLRRGRFRDYAHTHTHIHTHTHTPTHTSTHCTQHIHTHRQYRVYR
jgi:hypothetical protein